MDPSCNNVNVNGNGKKSPSNKRLFNKLWPTDTQYQTRISKTKNSVLCLNSCKGFCEFKCMLMVEFVLWRSLDTWLGDISGDRDDGDEDGNVKVIDWVIGLKTK